jgi:hypothetical protein
MTGAAFRLDTTVDLSPWQGMVDRMRTFGGDPMDRAMDELGEGLVSSTIKRVHSQHSPSGVPWPQSERAKQDGGETLIDKRMLLLSFTHNVLQGQGVEWGSPVKYARVHNEGADIIIEPHTVKVFRRVESGKGASGQGWSAFANGGRFAKASKANFSWETVTKRYTVHLPQREFLGLDNADISNGISVLTKHLAAEILARDLGAVS